MSSPDDDGGMVLRVGAVVLILCMLAAIASGQAVKNLLQLVSTAAAVTAEVKRTPFPVVCCRKDCDAPATHTLRIRAWSQFTKQADRTPANGIEFWVRLSPCKDHGGEILAMADEIVERSHLRIVTELKRINRAGRYVYELDAVDINEALSA